MGRPQRSPPTLMAFIFSSTWIHLSRIQVHPCDFDLLAISAVSLAKWMMAPSCFDFILTCDSFAALSWVPSQYSLMLAFNSSIKVLEEKGFHVCHAARWSSVNDWLVEAYRHLSAFASYLQTQKIEVAQTVFIATAFSCSFLPMSNSHKEISSWHWFITVTQLRALQRSCCEKLMLHCIGFISAHCAELLWEQFWVSKCGKELDGSSREVP